MDTLTAQTNPPQLSLILPIDENDKGLQTITIDHDEYEVIETGTKEKNGRVVYFTKYKLIKKI